MKLYVSVNRNETSISIQPVALLFLLAYYLLYQRRVNKWLLSLVALDPNSEKAKQARRQEIDKFKTTFRNYPVEKLELIVAERKLVGNAVIAAKELLIERTAALSNPTT
ncbi:hypothetical protein GCM10027346_31510 [Hymenobacter seoulensis]